MELSDEVLEWYALRILNIFDSSYIVGPIPSDLPEELYLRFLHNSEYGPPPPNPTTEKGNWATLYSFEQGEGELDFD